MRDRQRCRQWVRMGNDDTSCCNRKMISQNNWVIPPTVNFLYLTCGVVTQYHITSHHIWNSQLKPCVPVPVKLWFDLHFMSLQKKAKLCKSSLALDFFPLPQTMWSALMLKLKMQCSECIEWKHFFRYVRGTLAFSRRMLNTSREEFMSFRGQ